MEIRKRHSLTDLTLVESEEFLLEKLIGQIAGVLSSSAVFSLTWLADLAEELVAERTRVLEG